VSKLTWIIFGVIVAGVLATLVIVSRSANPQVDVTTVDTNVVLKASDASGQIADRVLGNPTSKVVLIEYGDFQCPGCGGAHPGINTIMEQYGDTVAFVFRNFPLSSIHQNAKAAAAAVESAGQQGKYWEMHNLVFESQDQWNTLSGDARTNFFLGYATQLGLDQAQFKADLESESVARKISFDQALGKKIGVNSTPTFYLDGTQVDSDIIKNVQQDSGDSLRDLLDSKLKQAGITPPTR
jgi:protein-disulfide isomerase